MNSNFKAQNVGFIFGYVMLSIYMTVFVRQYFWAAPEMLAWPVSFLISTLVVYMLNKHVREEDDYTVSFSFLFIVILPLVFLYALRFPFPDASWDVINYHHINGERALRGFPFIDGDFFYLSYSNPVGDMLTGIFRHILGYRLGTVINLLALIWASLVLDKLLHKYVSNNTLRYIAILLIFSFEGFSYEISNYWVDLLAIPLILEAVFILLYAKRKTVTDYILFSVLLGMAVGLKLTNLYIVVPLVLIAIFQFVGNHYKEGLSKLSLILVFFVAFLLPLLPFHVYIYMLTGNPIYPQFNWVFQSPFWSTKEAFDQTLGPSGTLERIFWPLVMLFKSGRLSPTPTFPILTVLGYIVSLYIILYSLFSKERKRLSTELNYVAVLVLSSISIWGFVSGDFRYVYIFELLAGLLILMFIHSTFNGQFKLIRGVNFSSSFKIAFITILLVLGFIKADISFKKVLQFEWAGRPTIFSNFALYKSEIKDVFRDHHLYKFLPPESKKLVDQAEVWMPSSPVVSGYMVLLNPNIPYVDLHHLPYRGTAGLAKFKETVKQLGAKQYFSLINVGTLGFSLEWSLQQMIKEGFVPLAIQNITVPFFSHAKDFTYKFALVSVVPKEFETQLLSRYSKKQVHKMKSSLVIAEWTKGCSALEKSGSNAWRWCGKTSSLRLVNYSDIDLAVDLSFRMQSGYQETSSVLISGADSKDLMNLPNGSSVYNKTINLKAGTTIIMKFDTNAKRVNAPGDPRSLYLRITDFKYKAHPATIPIKMQSK